MFFDKLGLVAFAGIQTAEQSLHCTRGHDVPMEGALSLKDSGYYSEIQYLNWTGRPLCIQHASGREITIASAPSYGRTTALHIAFRHCVGPRTYNSGGETTKSQRGHWNILLESLLSGPVYIHEFDVLVYFPDQRDVAVHPNSVKAREAAIEEAVSAAVESAVYAPITIVAHDENGPLSAIYAAIGDQIYTVPVQATGMIRQYNKVIVTVRDTLATRRKAPLVYTEYLSKLNDRTTVVTVGPVKICASYDLLKIHLGQKVVSDSDHLTRGEHNKIIAELSKKWESDLHDAKQEANHFRDKLNTSRRIISTITDENLTEQTTEVQMQTLDIERQKIDVQKRELQDRARKAADDARKAAEDARHKERDEIFKIVQNTVKTAGVVIPTILVLWKAYENWNK